MKLFYERRSPLKKVVFISADGTFVSGFVLTRLDGKLYS